MEVSSSREHSLGQGPREPSGWTAPPSSLFMALWRLLSPLFCQTSSLLTSKSARDLANICQDSSLTLCFPHIVFPSSVWIRALCTGKRCPWGLGGAPTFCRPRGPSCRHTRPESLHPPKVQLQATLRKMPPYLQYQTCPPGQEPHAGPVREMLTSSSSDFEVFGRREEGEFVLTQDLC